jgi:membrane protease YdiL (CAAX protease family)
MTFPELDDTAEWRQPVPAPHAVPWTWRDLGIGIAGILLLIFILSSAAYPFVEHYGEDSPTGRFIGAVTNYVWFVTSVAFVYFIVRRKGAGWRELGLRPPPARESRWFRLLGAVILTLLSAYVAVIIYGIIARATGLGFLEPDQQIEDDTYDSSLVVIATGFVVITGAPIAEELLFRGFLFAKLRMHLPFLVAAALSGSLFSFAHLDTGLVLPFTLVGIALAYIYEKSGTLWGSIGVHFCFNLLSFLVLVFVPDAR